MSHPKQVLFYSANDPFGEFSNFFPSPIFLDGKKWPTTEHYFQAMKFVGTKHEDEIREASTPGSAAKKGRQRTRPLRKDWEEVKDDIMLKCCRAKFQQHRSLRDLLISTGNKELIEHTHRDSYWADGGDGSGRNQLGITLMILRDEFTGKRDPPKEDDTAARVKAGLAATATSAAATAAAATASSAIVISDDEKDKSVTGKQSNSKSKEGKRKKSAENSSDSEIGEDEKNIYIKKGDLLQATEKYLVQQCNCVSTKAKGLSEHIFRKFPYADVYSNRKVDKVAGTVSVHGGTGEGRRIINLFGQVKPGKPQHSGHDSRESRLNYFKQGLDEISKIKDLGSIAFPFMIGCGLGGGDWTQYRKAIDDFATKVAPVRVVIYKLD